jgi:prepilin-type N-terminal cleavage/methylation domain-containing protein
MKKVLKNRKGFTLIELIIVIVIIAVLAAIAIPIVSGFVGRANRSAAIAEGNSIRFAIHMLSEDPSVPLPANTPAAWMTLIEDSDMFDFDVAGTIDALTLVAGSATNVAELTSLTYTNHGHSVIWTRATMSWADVP